MSYEATKPELSCRFRLLPSGHVFALFVVFWVRALFSSLSFRYQYQCNWSGKIVSEMTCYVSSGTSNLTNCYVMAKKSRSQTCYLIIGSLLPRPLHSHGVFIMLKVVCFAELFYCVVCSCLFSHQRCFVMEVMGRHCGWAGYLFFCNRVELGTLTPQFWFGQEPDIF